MYKAFFPISLILILGACQALSVSGPDHYLTMYQDFPPAIERFQVCHDVGCENLTPVVMGAGHWRQLEEIFAHPATDAETERQQVARAIARFERLVGPLAGTFDDQPRNQGGTHVNAQLDCIAETVNTTTYLTLFREQGWLRWHDVALPRHRGLFSLMGPHNTAVLVEKSTDREYVIDTWFHANGELPEIVPVEVWLAGYDPDDH